MLLVGQPGLCVLPVIREIRRAGGVSLHQIADALNARGITTPRGGQWYASECVSAHVISLAQFIVQAQRGSRISMSEASLCIL